MNKSNENENRKSSQRLDRFLSQAGVGTRSEVSKVLRRGHVELNGELIKDGSIRVSEADTITVDGATITSAPVLYLWHKPVGVQCTIGDPLGRISLSETVPPELLRLYHPVGRLDADTQGLLLFSRHGTLTQRLLHPRHGLPRRYRATCVSPFTSEQLLALERGIETSIGVFSAQNLTTNDNQIELTVTEGKHRMVRRMLANIEQPVAELVRFEYGPFRLGDLPEGSYRPPSKAEHEHAVALGLPGFNHPDTEPRAQ